MQSEDREWMEYIDAEVREACRQKGFGHQIRRKWSVRETPVAESIITDYEWKLIPGAQGRLPDTGTHQFDGVYYVLSFDKASGRFIFQHDTHHCGMWSSNWEIATYTEIHWSRVLSEMGHAQGEARKHSPPAGWLRDHLKSLMTRFQPNSFSAT